MTNSAGNPETGNSAERAVPSAGESPAPLFTRRTRAARRASGRVLVVDDNVEHCHAVADVLRDAGHMVQTATRPDEAVGSLQGFLPDVVVTDVCMPERDGFALLDAALRNDPSVGVVMMTGKASVPDAVRALHAGAEDYVPKPFATDDLLAAVDRALGRRRARAMSGPESPGASAAAFVGGSAAMRALLAQIETVAPTRSTVLIVGEAGAGKARVAEALHRGSDRAAGPFVTVHCGVVADNLLEAELFGLERGASPGVTTRREGRARFAEGGTLFIDEVGEISAAIQTKLVRLLEDGRYERVGGNESVTADVRIVASTHRDLQAMVERGQFRADLYYRLKSVTLQVPPLRARRDDIEPLIMEMLARLAEGSEHPVPAVTREAMELFTRYEWPGNVRELENVVETAFVAANGEAIRPAHVLPSLRGRRRSIAAGAKVAIPGSTFAEIERHVILSTYEACGQNALRTAQVLDISLRTVHYRLREYSGLTGRRRGTGPQSVQSDPKKQS